jgi:hypothetical protein
MDRTFWIYMGSFDLQTLTPQRCALECADHNYAFSATRNGLLCFCSNANSMNAQESLPDKSCSQPCAGDQTQLCGGLLALSTYTTAPFRIQLTVDPATPLEAQLGTDVALVLVITPASAAFERIDWTFGGTGLTKSSTDAAISHAFTATGVITVTATVVTQRRSRSTSFSVVVYQPVVTVLNVASSAATLAAAPITFDILSGAGSTMSANLTLASSNSQETTLFDVAVPEALVLDSSKAIKSLISLHESSQNTHVNFSSGSAYTLAAMPSSVFKASGLISSFEITLSEAANVTFVILRPSCTQGHVYCARSRQCVKSDSDSPASCSLPFDVRECSARTPLDTSDGTCGASEPSTWISVSWFAFVFFVQCLSTAVTDLCHRCRGC